MQVNRVFDFLQYQLENNPKQDTLASKINGKWETWSIDKVIDTVNSLSIGFLKKGITAGDKVAIISMNRPEWNLIDFALQQIGAVSVPMYPTITIKDYSYILKDSECKSIFVANEDLFEKATTAAAEQTQNISIYTFDHVENAHHWTEMQEPTSIGTLQEIESCKAKVKPEDLMTIIYTSGTTGDPKGVMISHQNIVSNVIASQPLLPTLGNDAKALSFLPLCHVYERMLSTLYLSTGISIYYAESMETIGDNLKEVKPVVFTTVPRLLEKVYDKIYAKGNEAKGIKKSLFFWALKLGMIFRVEQDNGFWYNMQLSLANKIIFSKWREALGGNVALIISGSAALQPRLSRIFWAAQIRVLEGYGLTETSPTISVNRPNLKECKFGTVGPMIDGVEVKIAAGDEDPNEGEILVKGPNVMMGYYKKPEKTAEVIKDGWFHTGDIGRIVDDKYLKITGRKKEIFKTSGGKYISPGLIENKFKESILIEQVMVIGEFKRFASALVVPSFENLRVWCEENEITYTTDEEMVCHERVVAKYEAEKERFNEHFARHEQIKQIRLMPKAWSVLTGELTPTLKCKRKNILKNCESIINDIYEQDYGMK